MTIRYTRRALSQLASLHEYISLRSAAAADNVTASIATTVVRLKYLPMLGVPTDEADVRVLIETQYHYRVFYRVVGSEVLVIRILHRAQGDAGGQHA
jgi:toxin ParE1/3/4